MNKQEIEKAIKCCERYKGVAKTYGKQKSAEEDIKSLETAISALEHQLTNGWIPVSERLPKEYKCVDGNDCYMMSEEVLCSAYNEETGEYDMWIDYTIDGEWQTHEYYEGEKLAWQNLPEPWKGAAK